MLAAGLDVRSRRRGIARPPHRTSQDAFVFPVVELLGFELFLHVLDVCDVEDRGDFRTLAAVAYEATACSVP